MTIRVWTGVIVGDAAGSVGGTGTSACADTAAAITAADTAAAAVVVVVVVAVLV